MNPVLHYGLKVGLLRTGDPADMILVEDLISFRVSKTFINGTEVFSENTLRLPEGNIASANRFSTTPLDGEDLKLKGQSLKEVRIIHAIDGALITKEMHAHLMLSEDGCYRADVARDILKIAVVNRYQKAPPAIAFIHGFGLKQGAIASSVAHDSHNIVAVGVEDKSMIKAINLIIAARGGIAAINENHTHHVLPLPVAGIMSDLPGQDVAELYTSIDHFSKHALGSTLRSPFMSLSFMALLVIPQLKLSDKGLFDGGEFKFVGLEV